MISIPSSLSFHSTLGEEVRSVTGYVWRPVGTARVRGRGAHQRPILSNPERSEAIT